MMQCYKKNYYRPQFVRDEWTDFCGEWDFVFDDGKVGEKKKFFKKFPSDARKIVVPFSYETPASGIGDETAHAAVWYRRTFVAEALSADKRYLLHFEGADYRTKVWLNSTYLGMHEGGSCRFTFDATDALTEGSNELCVLCEDSFDTAQPRGKQRWLKDSFGCWYVQTTGIWKPVWSEVVSQTRLERVKITPDVDTQSVSIAYEIVGETDGAEVRTKISFGSVSVANSSAAAAGRFTLTFDMRSPAFDFKVRQWSPGAPNLYDVVFEVYKDGVLQDRVGSYFGMRKIEADARGVRLNNSPLYQKLILAQNYWRETGYTMPDEEAAAKDLQYVREAGFNGVRLHQKIEDERFLARCDAEGILVWAEFPAAYEFGDTAIRRTITEWMEAVQQQYNHPSVIIWVPFNESWGIPSVFTEAAQQELTRGVYHLTKAYDPMRPVITNDGWEHTCSDIITLHDYDASGEHMKPRYADKLEGILSNRVAHGQFKFAFAEGETYRGQPVLISEYGGIALAGGNGWGYNGRVKDAQELLLRYEDLTEVIKQMPGVCGYCYTQLSDVYQEINGLLDFDHKPKVDLSKIRAINEK